MVALHQAHTPGMCVRACVGARARAWTRACECVRPGMCMWVSDLFSLSARNQTRTHAHLTSTILQETVAAGAPVAQLELARDSGLLAAACDDFVVRVFDANSRKLVRRLEGHQGKSVYVCVCVEVGAWVGEL